MNGAEQSDDTLAVRMRAALTPPAPPNASLAARFAARLREVAATPGEAPIEFNRARIKARVGGTLLGAALKNGVRLMHVCGARSICSTCRVRVVAGEENLEPMTTREKLALRYHLVLSPRTRLACRARVRGPVEAESILPLCGNLPGE